MNSTYRLLLSAAVAFVFYFAWAYWANSGVDIDPRMTLQSAFVQGLYSGGVTLGFTFLLEKAVAKLAHQCISLAFMVPLLCAVHSPSRQATAIRAAMNDALATSARWAAGSQIPGIVAAPLLPILIQSLLVISVNLINQTPNLWLTVAPSILFSALYAYSYSITLWRKQKTF